MKILFIMYDNESERNHMPVGTAYIAAYIGKHGFSDITYYSQDIYHYPEEHLTEYLDKNKFDVIAIGFVAGYYQFKKIKKICNAIRASKNSSFLVLGGHGPSPEPYFFIEEMQVNAVVMGEGETPFLSLLKALSANKSLENVKGIAYKNGDKIVINEREALVRDLDTIPFPFYDPLPMEYYINMKIFGMRPTERMIYMTSSRGCNYECNFCMRLEKGIRFRSPEMVVEEIKKYKRDYNISFVHFVDELFMFSKKRIAEMAEAFLKADLNIKYFCTGRVNIATDEILMMMKKSGCVFIDYGIEQFDNKALLAMNKKQTEEDITRAIEKTKKHEIGIAFNIIFGNIGDTRESLRKSMDFLKRYNNYSQLRVIRPVTPYPGSPLYYYALEKGLLKGPADFYEKHKNLELLTVNFTNIPDDEFHQLLMRENEQVINDYYEFQKQKYIHIFKSVYFDNNVEYRGARH